MIKTIADILIKYSLFALAPPLLIGILRFKNATKIIRFVIALIIVSASVSFLSAILWYNRMNNLPLLHIYTPVEFVLLSVFYQALLKNSIHSKIIPLICLAFIIYSVINSLYVQTITSHNTYTRGVEALIMIAYSLLAYYKLFANSGEKDLFKDPAFLINTGYFIYFSASFFLFILSNRLSGSVELRHIFWGIHAVFIFILYGIITIAFSKIK